MLQIHNAPTRNDVTEIALDDDGGDTIDVVVVGAGGTIKARLLLIDKMTGKVRFASGIPAKYGFVLDGNGELEIEDEVL